LSAAVVLRGVVVFTVVHHCDCTLYPSVIDVALNVTTSVIYNASHFLNQSSTTLLHWTFAVCPSVVYSFLN